MPNAKNLGVGLLVTALIVGIVGQEAYKTGNWNKISSDFSGKLTSMPFSGTFAANQCGSADKLGRSTKGEECELDFRMELNMQGKKYFMENDQVTVDGQVVATEAPAVTDVDTSKDIPMKKIGPNTLSFWDGELEITFTKATHSRRLFGGSWSAWSIYNLPYTSGIWVVFNPTPMPLPSITPSPTYLCARAESWHDNGSIYCLAGMLSSLIVRSVLTAAAATATALGTLLSGPGGIFVGGIIVGAGISWATGGVGILSCAKIILHNHVLSDDRICNPIAFSLNWSLPPLNMGF